MRLSYIYLMFFLITSCVNYNRLNFGHKHNYNPFINEASSLNVKLFDSLNFTSNEKKPCDTLILIGGLKEEFEFIKETKKHFIYSYCNKDNSRVIIPKTEIYEIRFNDGRVGYYRRVKSKHSAASINQSDLKKGGIVTRDVGRITFILGIIATIVSLALPFQLVGWVSLGLMILGLLILIIGLLIMHFQGTLDYQDLGGWLLGLGIGFGSLSVVVGVLMLFMGGGIGILVVLSGGLLASLPIYFGIKMRDKTIFVIEDQH